MAGSARVGVGGSGGGVIPLRPDCAPAFAAKHAARKRKVNIFLIKNLWEVTVV
jgi:hypothetical protein